MGSLSRVPITGYHALLALQLAPTLEMMLKATFAASTLLFAAAIFACGANSNGDSVSTEGPKSTNAPTVAPRVSPGSKPTDVPMEATPVVQTSTLGEITRQADKTPQTNAIRELTDGVCANDLLTIHTSLETIYATLTCDKFDNDQFAQYFAGKPAALVLEVSPDRYRILIETLDGAQAEFTPDAIWVE